MEKIKDFLRSIYKFFFSKNQSPIQNLILLYSILIVLLINATNLDIGGYYFELNILNDVAAFVPLIIVIMLFFNSLSFKKTWAIIINLFAVLLILFLVGTYYNLENYWGEGNWKLIARYNCNKEMMIGEYEYPYVEFSGNGEIARERVGEKRIFPGILKRVENYTVCEYQPN